MSGIEKRNHYAEKFKREAVKALLKSGKPVVEMAVILGVEQSVLHRWKAKFAPELTDIPKSSTFRSLDPNEIYALKNEIVGLKATVRHLRNIIKKCVGDRYQLSDQEATLP
jgi:transposase-like protein